MTDFALGTGDPLGALSSHERLRWAQDVVRSRAALIDGLAVSGAWMVRRAEAILAGAGR